jgi:hypothetical protein
MAWTQADLDQINQAIATGATRVSLPSSGSVEYRGLNDMLRIRKLIDQDLAAAVGTTTKPSRVVKISASKGL